MFHVHCNDIEKGTPSTKSELIKTLDRDIALNQDTVNKFATNLKTKMFNHDKLKLLFLVK
jgi:hypothetical protein